MSKWYGSIENRLAEGTLQPVPVVGMGAYLSLYSDRTPYTVKEVSKETTTVTMNVKKDDGSIVEVTREYPKVIIASEDDFKVIKGSMQNGSAEYEFIETDRNIKFVFHKLTKVYRQASRKFVNGTYVETNTTKTDRTALILGYKDKYYDPSF